MIRVILADDHPVVRSGLVAIVNKASDLYVVGEASDGAQLMALLGNHDADVVVTDLSMPGIGWVDLFRIIKKEAPTVGILVLTVHSETQYAVRTLKAGALGYLTKDLSAERLLDAIRVVAQGRTFVSEKLSAELAGRLATGNAGAPHDSLSNREYQVFSCLGIGKTVTETASELGLSPKTVSTYRTRILQKMQMKTNSDIVRYCITRGLGKDEI